MLQQILELGTPRCRRNVVPPPILWLAHSVPTLCRANLGHLGQQFCTVTERHRVDLHQLGNVHSIHAIWDGSLACEMRRDI